MQVINQGLVVLAAGTANKQQKQEPTSLEPAQHTMQELQLMARPLEATLKALSELKNYSNEGTVRCPWCQC
jgi:hypothetical protein